MLSQLLLVILCLGSWSGSALASNVGDPELKAVLEKIAIGKEVVACVSNSALITPDGAYGMLRLWVDGMRHAGVTNFLVIAIDDKTADAMKAINVSYWRKTPQATLDKHESNHGISARKFQLVKEFLTLGYSILLSDVDILTLKDPFTMLHRDSDVEAMSDGFDERTAYGWDDVFDDPKMGWSRWAHGFRIFSLNSGLFYLRPNVRTLELMERITERLNKENAWDQAVFNEMVLAPSHTTYKSPGVTARVMDMYEFVNSKTLFQTMRYEKKFAKHTPTMVHVNYHPDKFERMQHIWKRYVEGDMHALDRFPVGSA